MPLCQVLPPKIQASLSPDLILADDEVVKFGMQEEPVTCYTDEVLRNDPVAMREFVGRLASKNLLGC